MAQSVKERFERMSPFLDEKGKRLFTANEAKSIGRGGISEVSEATGVARRSIRRGIEELALGPEEGDTPVGTKGRTRKPGGGRKPVTESDPTLVTDLMALLDPVTRGDPDSPLLWTSKSLRNLEGALHEKGHRVSHVTVGSLLVEMGFSLQADYKNLEPGQHADRNGQFEYIYEATKETQAAGQPVISVDTKKRELVGLSRNGGRDWYPKGCPPEVGTHDFEDKGLGHAIPYGIYDLTKNEGWVSIGITKDTSQFAVNSIRSWYEEMGRDVYPEAAELMITADSGGSNGYRRKLWKTELQRFSDETGLVIHVLHFPPGTSKWNKIEHRMFSFISKNWRTRPLVDLATIVSLIASTTTETGLSIKCAVDGKAYMTGIKVTDAELDGLSLVPDKYHGEWNYRLYPRI